ncbi:bystin-like [Biomphalaria glabrata]|uniref:Bystin-like n=1 Tax=Biomphalaria glabrata TaxID=6526 RepID=A0A9U8E3Z9_BIOGL|nr:bystin-like [Biomphalaria glabrata]
MGKVKNQRKRLHEQIKEQQHVQVGESNRTSKVRHRTEDEKFVDEKLSRKILAQVRKQGEDLLQEFEGLTTGARPKQKRTEVKHFKLGGASAADSDSDDDAVTKHLFDNFSSLEKTVMEINDEDEEDLRKFMNPNPKQRKTLAEIISEKLAETKTAMSEVLSDVHIEEEIDETVRDHFIKIGEVLSHYRSGKLPKGFKAIPTFPNWQQLLELTKPENWTAASIYAGTRIFVSNLPKYQFKHFCSLVLLPRIRDDILEYKRLNFHLFQALHKGIYKPGDFYEGIVLPLCEAGDCTLREATIVAGVLSQSSIPVGYSAAALILISKMDYNGANSIFMRAILNKKYSLPLSAIDATVEHFMRFLDVNEKMPVLWHQCLLMLVQRYKNDLTKQQKSQILKLVCCHDHHEITPEIRREITQSKRSRGDPEVEGEEDV